MKDRFLITTAIESTWPVDDQPVLFLGEWCKLYSRKHLWKSKDSEVVPFQWDDRAKLYQDQLDLLVLYESILEEISKKLNSLHEVNYSSRYWRILIGPWLFGFITVLYDRWSSIEKAISSYNISKTIILDYSQEESIPQNMQHYLKLSKTDQWNHFIYSSILKKIKFNKTIDQGLKDTDNLMPRLSIEPQRISKKVSEAVSKLSSLFSKKNDKFIIGPSLSKFDLFRLQLKLFQFPALYSIPDYSEQLNPDIKVRKWRVSDSKVDTTAFEQFLREMIPLQIPIIYLEGYQRLRERSANVSWPKNPKLIWTSTAFYDEDLFKIWTADKVEKNTPLLIGQHGGHYGIGLFDLLENHELKICDYYLSWGSKKTNKKIIPTGIFKRYKKRVKKDFALLIIASTSRYVTSIASMPISSQMSNVFEDQLKFIERLPDYILNNFIVRTYPNDYEWGQYDRFTNKFPKLEIDNGKEKIEDVWVNTKVSISMWNSTTMLESMATDIPTIIFWNPEFFELQESSLDYFDQLKKVGIFHESPESAADHLIKIWDNIDAWWQSPEVMKAKNNFIGRYANTDDLLGSLTKALEVPSNFSDSTYN